MTSPETTLYGLEAIAKSHGWEYAALGVTIVFTGLIVLSLVISQLHKILTLWDNRSTYIEKFKSSRDAEGPIAPESPVLDGSIKESARQFKLLVDWIGEPFALVKLLERAEKAGIFRPHSTMNELISAGVIVPDGTGYYRWRS